MFSLETWCRVVSPPPVRIERDRCLTARHRLAGCSACVDICPTGALALDGQRVTLHEDACDGCGLCAGVCLTGAVQVRGATLETLAPDADGVVRLHCSRASAGPAEAASPGAVQLPCLGWLTVEHGIRLAQMSRRVELLTGECGTCPWARGGERLGQVVERSELAARALGLLTEFVTTVSPERPVVTASRVVNRRDFFTLLGLEAKSAGQVLYEDFTGKEEQQSAASESRRVPARRRMWLKHLGAVRAGGDLSALPLTAKTAGPGCDACGLCARACPTGAMRLAEEEGRLELTHKPADCLACGLCTSLCPWSALKDAPLEPERFREAHLLASGWRRTCSTCRRPFMATDPEKQVCSFCG